VQKPKQIKDNLFLIEPTRILAAMRKNMLNILLSTVLFTLIGIKITSKDTTQTWHANGKIMRYKKKISNSKDIPYTYQEFNYKTVMDTMLNTDILNEVIKRLDLNISADELRSHYSLNREKGHDIIEISFSGNEQKLAADAVNTLNDVFIHNFHKTLNKATYQVYEYYLDKKKAKEKELFNAKQKITIFLSKYNLTSLENEMATLYKILETLKLTKLEKETQLIEAQTAIEKINKRLQNIPKEVKLSYAISSDFKKALGEKERELERESTIYSKDHPKMKMIKTEVEQLRKIVKASKKVEPDIVSYGGNPLKKELKIQLERTNITYVSTKGSKAFLEKKIEEINSKISSLKDLSKQYDKLQRRVEELDNQLKTISQRLYKIKISMGTTKEDFQLFEKATMPHHPQSNSMKKVIIILFTILGFIIFTVFIIVREILSDSIKTKFDLQKRFGILDTIQLPRGGDVSSINKQTFSFLVNRIVNEHVLNTHIITLASDTPPKQLINNTVMLLEQLSYQKHRILYIRSSIYNRYSHKNALHMIDLCKPLESQNYMVEKGSEYIDTLYWNIEDDYSVFVPNKEDLNKVFATLKESNYSFVVIDLPPYIEAEHLIPMCIKQSDTFILSTEFKTSSRKLIHKMLLQIHESDFAKIKGVINHVHKYFLS